MVARESNDTLDETLRRVARIAKYHNVATLNRLQPINKLVDKNTFLIVKRRHHARALDSYWLIQENDEECGDSQGDHQVSHPHGKNATRASGGFGFIGNELDNGLGSVRRYGHCSCNSTVLDAARVRCQAINQHR